MLLIITLRKEEKTPRLKQRLRGPRCRHKGTKAHRHKAEKDVENDTTLCLCRFVPQAVGFSRQLLTHIGAGKTQLVRFLLGF